MIYRAKLFLGFIAILIVIAACNNNRTSTTTSGNESTQVTDTIAATYDSTFKVEAESFADVQLLRYQVPGFHQLTLPQKQLAFYLSEAALCGRDIIYDQKSKYGILLR